MTLRFLARCSSYDGLVSCSFLQSCVLFRFGKVLYSLVMDDLSRFRSSHNPQVDNNAYHSSPRKYYVHTLILILSYFLQFILVLKPLYYCMYSIKPPSERATITQLFQLGFMEKYYTIYRPGILNGE